MGDFLLRLEETQSFEIDEDGLAGVERLHAPIFFGAFVFANKLFLWAKKLLIRAPLFDDEKEKRTWLSF